MVLHAGIYPEIGMLYLYDDVNKIKSELEFDEVKVFTKNSINFIFNQIGSHREFGCACFCLRGYVDNNSRKMLVETSLKFGFKKAEIIDRFTEEYIKAVASLKVPLQVDDLILISILRDETFYVWKKTKEKGILILHKQKKDMKEVLSELKQPIKVAFCYFLRESLYKYLPIVQESLYEFLPKNVVHHMPKTFDGSLFKARIMAGEEELQSCDATTMLTTNWSILRTNELWFEFPIMQPLPVTVTKLVKHGRRENVLRVFNDNQLTEMQWMPLLEEFVLTFTIDTNGIYSCEYNELNAQKNLLIKPNPVFHVGISLTDNAFLIYNSQTKCISAYSFEPISATESNKVEAVFQKIKSKINGEFGFACVKMDTEHANYIRKKIVDSAFSIGFKDVKLMDDYELFYLNAVSQANYTPKNNDIIWIFQDIAFTIWKKKDNVANFVLCERYFRLTELEEKVTELLINQAPSVVYSYSSMLSRHLLSRLFIGCPIFYISEQSFQFCALLKALILAENKDYVGVISISREQFETMSKPLLNKIQNTLNAALYNSGYYYNEINKVLHVGGGTRMPMIKNLLKSSFPQAEQCCEKNPDEVVAVGSAYYACSIIANNK